MSQTDHAADQFLTEAAFSPRQSEGKALMDQLPCEGCMAVGYHGYSRRNCAFTCYRMDGTRRNPHECYCIHCATMRVVYLLDNNPDADRLIAYRQSILDKAINHEKALRLVEEHRAAQALREQNQANAKADLGPREFTLTFSLGTHYADDDMAKAAMTSAIEKLTRYYKDEIIEFHGIGEYTAAGRPHVHGWYHLRGGRKITDKNFKRAYPPWNPKRKLGRGFEGGHHQTIERVSDFHGYTEKHLEEAWLVVNITNADDSARASTPGGVLEGLNSTEGEKPLEGHPCSEEPSPSRPQGGGDDC